jgi:release factor glutamine methyltransferase
MTISQWLDQASDALKAAGIRTYRLDAELILADSLERERVYVHAHGDLPLPAQSLRTANTKLEQRKKRTPLAYILGQKEFYGRTFAVTPDVLIPRPETEMLIGLLPDAAECSLIDVGTGSGAIAITAKLEHPDWAVTASDIDEEVLLAAAHNADNLGARIALRRSDLLADIDETFDIIAANLPYVDREWERSPETDFEPALALFANNHGLELIEKLIEQAPDHLTSHGYLLFEADPEQHPAIIAAAKEKSLRHMRTEGYGVLLQR